MVASVVVVAFDDKARDACAGNASHEHDMEQHGVIIAVATVITIATTRRSGDEERLVQCHTDEAPLAKVQVTRPVDRGSRTTGRRRFCGGSYCT